MSHNLSFDVSYLYEESAEGITIPVTLSYKDSQIRTYAKVDTGAEFCIFSLARISQQVDLQSSRS